MPQIQEQYSYGMSISLCSTRARYFQEGKKEKRKRFTPDWLITAILLARQEKIAQLLCKYFAKPLIFLQCLPQNVCSPQDLFQSWECEGERISSSRQCYWARCVTVCTRRCVQVLLLFLFFLSIELRTAHCALFCHHKNFRRERVLNVSMKLVS